MPPSNERPEDNSDKNNFEITSQLISEDEDYGSYKEVHQDEKEKINTFYLKKPRDEHFFMNSIASCLGFTSINPLIRTEYKVLSESEVNNVAKSKKSNMSKEIITDFLRNILVTSCGLTVGYLFFYYCIGYVGGMYDTIMYHWSAISVAESKDQVASDIAISSIDGQGVHNLY